jgi:uncharacterized protein YbjT (DUF2867 family)
MMEAKGRHSIAISGANGALGRELCRHFLSAGYEVFALSRCGQSPVDGCRHLSYQLGDPAPAELPLLRAFIHCAWSMNPGDAALNVRAVYALKSSLMPLDVPLIFVSSLHAGAEAPSIYLRCKHESEQLLDHGFDSILRPGLIMLKRGLWGRLAALAGRWRIIPYPLTRARLYLTNPSDICSSMERITREGMSGKYNLAIAKGLSLGEILRQAARAQDRRPFLIPLPYHAVALVLWVLGALHTRPRFGIDNLRGLRADSRRESTESRALFGLGNPEPSELIKRYFDNETTP